MRIPLQSVSIAVLALALAGVSLAQEAPAPKPEPRATSVSPRVRLAEAKTIYLKNLGGDDIPFTIISNALSGWPQYAVLDADHADKADLIVEVAAPEDPNAKDKDKGSDTGVRAGYNGRSVIGGNQQQQQPSNSNLPTSDVKMTVRDAHTRAVLWAGSEPTHEAFRRNKQDENLEAAAQKLVQRFEKAVNPDTAKEPQQ